jgi:putative spermidine/putrescine transport system substrate-binding protein
MKNLLLALALLACGSSLAHAGQFDGVVVRIGTFGGKWRDVVEKTIGAAFAKEGGRLEFVLGQPADNLARLIAARGAPPPFDMLETMDNLLPALKAGKYLAPIDLANVPNTAKLDPKLFDPDKVMIWVTEEGVVYNRKIFAEKDIRAPATYRDLANPALKGHVSLPDINAGGAIPALVGMSIEAGGSESDITPGLALVKKIAPSDFWSSSSVLQTGLASGDIWAVAAQAGNVQRLRGQADLAVVFPPIGGKVGVLKQGYLVKIAGGSQPRAVEWIMNQFLAMPMQLATFRDAGQVPVSNDALEALHAEPGNNFLRLAPAEIAGMYRIDFSKVNEAAYVRAWTRNQAP